MAAPALSRERLLQSILLGAPRLVLLTAPAGYGKSTLARALLGETECAAVSDLAGATQAADVARALLDALAGTLAPATAAAIAEQYVALAGSGDAWIAFARQCFARHGPGRTIALDNAEAIAPHAAARQAVESILGAAAGMRAIICSRVALHLRLGRFAGPDATVAIGADELRFSDAEVRDVFAGNAIGEAALRGVIAFSRGWPIVVMMLYNLAKRGRLESYLARDAGDVADLYGYLAAEVLALLDPAQRRLLTAIAAIPGASLRELATVEEPAGLQRRIDDLERSTPFVRAAGGGTIEVHPALREMLARTSDADGICERVLAAIDRDDGGVRAAELALHLGRPDAAAAALVVGPFLLSPPGPRLNAILSAIPDDVAAQYPAVWNAARLARLFQIGPVRFAAEAERIWSTLRASDPLDLRLGIATSLWSAYHAIGDFAEGDRVCAELLAITPAAEHSVVGEAVAFWSYARDVALGRDLDLGAARRAARVIARTPTGKVNWMYAVHARVLRHRGDLPGEERVLDHAWQIAEALDLPILNAVLLPDMMFAAWFRDDNVTFRRRLAALEAKIVPTIEPGLRFLIDCAHGRAADAHQGPEQPKARAYGYLFAAGNARDPHQRRAYAAAAIEVADEWRHAYLQAVSRVVAALCASDGGALHLAAAVDIARTIDAPALALAIERLQLHGHARETMLAALVARFAPHAAGARFEVHLVDGHVTYGGHDVALSNRERDIIAYLALAKRPAARAAMLAALWPERDAEDAAATLKTLVSRIRKRCGNPRAILFRDGAYQCEIEPSVVAGQPPAAARIAMKRAKLA